jgi:hypothetical protein
MAKSQTTTTKPKKIKKPKPDTSSVPCLRVVVGAKSGRTGQVDANACTIVGESRVAVTQFDLNRSFRSTSKSVDSVDGKSCGQYEVKKGKHKGKIKPRPCPKPCAGALKRKGCPVQLAFDKGQPFLRFCTTDKQPGVRVDVDSPMDAVAKANAACGTWAATGKFDFPPDMPLRGRRRK